MRDLAAMIERVARPGRQCAWSLANPAPARSWWPTSSTAAARAKADPWSPWTAARPRPGCWNPSFSATSKGSFTHAVKDKKGLIEQANQGTLFLDEIGNISSEMQIAFAAFFGKSQNPPHRRRARDPGRLPGHRRHQRRHLRTGGRRAFSARICSIV